MIQPAKPNSASIINPYQHNQYRAYSSNFIAIQASITTAVGQIAEATVNSKFQNSAVSFDAVTEAFDLGEHKGNASLIVHNHSVVFKNLKPETTYVYRVGDGQKYWSEWIQFKTAKSSYGKSQFVYFGDAQNDVLDHWSRVIRMAYKTAPDASFAVHAGDLINLAHSRLDLPVVITSSIIKTLEFLLILKFLLN